MKLNDRKIGIMGGTFNPIHLGHLILAQLAYEQAGLDHVLFMPSKKPPHKRDVDIVEDEHRLKMVSLAIENNPVFSVSTVELEREGFTYTADTLTQLTREYPDKEFYFIIGGDSFLQFEQWKNPDIIAAKCTLVCAGRDEMDMEKLIEQKKHLEKTLNVKSVLLDMPNIQISSSNIRERIAQGLSVTYYLPERVLDYMLQHQLYGR